VLNFEAAQNDLVEFGWKQIKANPNTSQNCISKDDNWELIKKKKIGKILPIHPRTNPFHVPSLVCPGTSKTPRNPTSPLIIFIQRPARRIDRLPRSLPTSGTQVFIKNNATSGPGELDRLHDEGVDEVYAGVGLGDEAFGAPAGVVLAVTNVNGSGEWGIVYHRWGIQIMLWRGLN